MNIGCGLDIVEFSINCDFNRRYQAQYIFYDKLTGTIFAKYTLYENFGHDEIFLTDIVKESLCDFLLESTKYFGINHTNQMVDLMTLKKRIIMNNKIEELWN